MSLEVKIVACVSRRATAVRPAGVDDFMEQPHRRLVRQQREQIHDAEYTRHI